MKKLIWLVLVATSFAQSGPFSPSGGSQSLTLNVSGGIAAIGTTPTLIQATTVPLVGNTTNYVFVDLNVGIVTSNTSGFTNTEYPIATAITNSTQVTVFNDVRPGAFNVSGTGGGGGTIGGSVTPGTLPIGVTNTTTLGNSNESEVAGVFTIATPNGMATTASGGGVFSAPVFASTSVTVPSGTDYSIFLGSDDIYRCQLSVALGSGSCINFSVIAGQASASQVADLSATYVLQSQLNNAAQYATAYYSAAGSSNVLSGISPPATNGIWYEGYSVTASTALPPSKFQFGMSGRSITGAATTDTVLYSDVGTTISHDVAGSQSVTETLPTATTLVNPNMVFSYANHSTHVDTITPVTWTIQAGTTAAGASLSVAAGQTCRITVDANSATNWHADCFDPVGSVNGAAVPASAFLLGSNSSKQLIAAQPFVVNAQTTTYQVLAADFAGCKTIPVSSGTFTITLVASGTQPASGQCVEIINYGSGVVTVARSGQNINGAASNLTLAAGSASAPTGVFVVSDGTNYVADLQGGGGSATPALSAVTGSATQATGTETAAGNNYTFAGVETANLTSAFNITDANSTNNNTNVGLMGGVTGTSTGGIGGLIYDVSGTGDILRLYSGGSVANATYTVGTLANHFTSAGEGFFGSTAPNPTLGTSGGLMWVCGTAPTGIASDGAIYCNASNFVDVLTGTTDLGAVVAEASIIGANVIPKAIGTNPGIVASSITDNGTTVSTAEPIVVGTSAGTPGITDKTVGVTTAAMGAQTTATCTNITGMTWNIAANKNYVLECKVPMTLAATATIQYCLGGPGTATSYSLEADGDLGTAGVWSQISTLAQTAYGTKTNASAAVAANTVQHVWAMIQNGATASGTALTLQTAANGTNAITVGANASCSLTQAN